MTMSGQRWRDAAILVLVAAGAAGIPLFFRPDPFDMFRLPKAMFLRAEAILILAVVWSGGLQPAGRRILGGLKPAAPLLVFLILTLTSTNRLLSLDALATAAATLIVFLATVFVARRHATLLLTITLAAFVVNALLVIVEEAGLWMPFGERSDVLHHLQCSALIGNPNEVGSCLGAAALACLASTWSRVPKFLALAVLGVGLLASQTLTAMIAFSVAALTLFAMTSWKRAVGAAIAIAIVLALFAPIRRRAIAMAEMAGRGDYNAIFTERFTAFTAAWTMFAEHPLTGVGPGAFAWQYFDTKVAVERRHPSLRHVYNRGFNFGEVHNDHLQVLAEGGLLGYAAFATLFVFLARLRHPLALPLVVFWLVLSIAQFPLETTVVRSLLVHLAALCVGNRE